ncbi:MAG TPA: CapA family protein [Candidatus Pacearchaeota archaeon]|nr:CapA family protein [Candidatus Pacearchaeota archaeon]
MANKRISELISLISFAILAVFFVFFINIIKDNFDFFSSQRFNDIISFDYQKEANFENFLAKKKQSGVKDSRACFVVAGDLMPSRGVGQKLRQKGCEYVFGKIKNYFDYADFSIVNLESPISDCPQLAPDTMEFCAPKEVAACLNSKSNEFSLGIDIALLANNHMMNFKEKGLQDTLDSLESKGILHIGAGNNQDQANTPIFIERKGIKFALLDYTDRDVLDINYAAQGDNPGVNPMDFDLLEKGIYQAKGKADFIIVFIHSGTEYVQEANKRQIEFAHKAIDLGAELVVGSHPHVVQNAEIYKGKYIFYSLGNFSFDQMWSQDTRNGLVAKFCFSEKELKNIELVPIQINDYSQPNFIFGDTGKEILKRLKIREKNTEILFFNNGYKSDSIAYLGEGAIKNKDRIDSNINIGGNETIDSCELSNGILKIFVKDSLIYKSDSKWYVDDFKFADIDNDGILELNISVWKAGSFGKSKPFWEKDDPSVKNHFFVLKIAKRRVLPLWQSSNLEKPNCEFDFADIDNDGLKELIVLEGEYSDDFSCHAKRYAVLDWNDWGFEKSYQSQDGNYNNLRILSLNDMFYAFIDKD